MKTLKDGTKIAETDAEWGGLSRKDPCDCQAAQRERRPSTCVHAEKSLVEEYRRVEETYNAVSKRVSAHFMGLIAQVKTREEGMALVGRCPDDVTKCFMIDHLNYVKKFPR